MLAAAFISALPAWADYETGQRAWDAGHLNEALAQWRVAADAGDRRAMLALGRLYVQGLGAPQDYLEAHKWFNLAASRGEAAAVKERDALAAKMTPQQVVAAQERAAAWQSNAGQAAGSSQVTGASILASDAGPPPPRAIREAQELLGSLGYAPGPADGVWAARSAHAYREFLRDAGLPAAETLTPEALHAMRANAKRQGGRAAIERRQSAAPRDTASAHPEATASSPMAVQAEALHRAAQTGDIGSLNAAIAAGAGVDARDGRGWTALMHAVNNGYILLVEPLLAARANPDIRAPDGATALFMAALHGHAEIFARLVEAGADASIPGPQGRTPLDVAHLKGDTKLLALPAVVALMEAEASRREREAAALRTQAESEAFSKAKSLDTRQAYKDYLSAWCPGREFCDTATTRLNELIETYIAGKIFRGDHSHHTIIHVTYRLSSSNVATGSYHNGYVFGILAISHASGTWHVENGKVLVRFSAGMFGVGVSAAADLDGGVLVGREDWSDGTSYEVRLRKHTAEDVVKRHMPSQRDHDSGGK